MQIAMLGTGAIGLGSAALLVSRGHHVRLWSPTGALKSSHTATISATGALSGTFPAAIADTLADALKTADVAMIAVTGNHHRALYDAIAPLLTPGQSVIVSSHCSFGAAYLVAALEKRGISLPIIAWGSTVVTGRRLAPLGVTIANIRARLDLAAFGAPCAALSLCNSLFGERFQERRGLAAITLSNVNPQNHLAMALLNFTRIEKGEAWGNYAGITASGGRLIEALDQERLAIARAFGVEVRSVNEHFHRSFDVPMASIAEQAALIDARGGAPNGPATTQTRYVLEDIPFGVVPIEKLGAIAGVTTPLHTAGIELFGAMYGVDFRSQNNLLAGVPLDALRL